MGDICCSVKWFSIKRVKLFSSNVQLMIKYIAEWVIHSFLNVYRISGNKNVPTFLLFSDFSFLWLNLQKNPPLQFHHQASHCLIIFPFIISFFSESSNSTNRDPLFFLTLSIFDGIYSPLTKYFLCRNSEKKRGNKD